MNTDAGVYAEQLLTETLQQLIEDLEKQAQAKRSVIDLYAGETREFFRGKAQGLDLAVTLARQLLAEEDVKAAPDD